MGEFVGDDSGACSQHPSRVEWHEQELHKLGLSRLEIYSFLNRAGVPVIDR
jgi:hypothetical protein